jgi:pyruvate/2-oxoacid:ferredoxin oxidoreductase alpha subunit
VLFTSSDCTAGAHVYGSSYAGVRATTQVQTPAGIMLMWERLKLRARWQFTRFSTTPDVRR